MHYVYIYLDPRKFGLYNYDNHYFNFEPIYVGKGTNNRCYDHLYRTDNAPLPCKLQKLNRLNFAPIIIKYKIFNNSQDAFDFEIEMISSIGRKDLGKGPLVNLSDGGEGNTGFIYSDEFKKAHSERMLQWAKDNPVSAETRRKLSKRSKGRTRSKESIDKMVATRIKNGNTNHTEETKKKMSEARKDLGPLSNEVKDKISKSLKGKKTWNKGKKTGPRSPEQIENMKEAQQKRWAKQKARMLDEKGMHTDS